MADTIIHGQYRYKPDESVDKYVTMYFENDSDDVKIVSNIDLGDFTGETLSELLIYFKAKIDDRTVEIYTGTKEQLRNEAPTLRENQIGFEIDTYRIKIGDGGTGWNYLPYVSGGPELQNKVEDIDRVLTALVEIMASKSDLEDAVNSINNTIDELSRRIEEDFATKAQVNELNETITDLITRINQITPLYMTKSRLEHNNPTPAAGQFCIEMDTNKIKVGNGKSSYLVLPYITGGTGGGESGGSSYSSVEEANEAIAEVFKDSVCVYDTAYSLQYTNPILNNNQIAIELDTGKIKVGDGTTAWNDLDYIDTTSADQIDTVVTSLTLLLESITPVENTKEGFETANTVLPLDCIAIETDTGYIKIGNGSTAYKDLVYLSVDQEEIAPLIETINKLIETSTPVKGTSADFASDTTVLAVGQIAYETDTGNIKIGDGETPLKDLSYANTDLDNIVEQDVEAKDNDVTTVVNIAGEDVQIDVDTLEGLTSDPTDSSVNVYVLIQE